ncbi:hypothetical protein BJ166DRAFT_368446 [Pestalotiopsis sp. NC0098]|nr:hypothetical protein BJ166DRAFT_368446 [Pestalotiopsis sp. NC0098]
MRGVASQARDYLLCCQWQPGSLPSCHSPATPYPDGVFSTSPSCETAAHGQRDGKGVILQVFATRPYCVHAHNSHNLARCGVDQRQLYRCAQPDPIDVKHIYFFLKLGDKSSPACMSRDDMTENVPTVCPSSPSWCGDTSSGPAHTYSINESFCLASTPLCAHRHASSRRCRRSLEEKCARQDGVGHIQSGQTTASGRTTGSRRVSQMSTTNMIKRSPSAKRLPLQHRRYP